jgi:hypothetical protein
MQRRAQTNRYVQKDASNFKTPKPDSDKKMDFAQPTAARA